LEKKKQTVLITGGTGGIGSAIAKKLDSSEFYILLTDLQNKNSISADFFPCDLRKPEEIQQLYDWIIKNYEIPKILILNAGLGIKEKISEGDPEKWQKVFDVNLMGTLRCLRAFLPEILANKNGHIIFISSVAANQTFEYGGIYSASKTALEIIAETLRIENISNLQVTTISSGAVNTDFFKNQLAGFSEKDYSEEMLNPEEIANTVYWCIKNTENQQINKIVVRPKKQKF